LCGVRGDPCGYDATGIRAREHLIYLSGVWAFGSVARPSGGRFPHELGAGRDRDMTPGS
jgi:hypothetical protein